MGRPFNTFTIIISMYTEIFSFSRATHISWMENNPDGHLLKVLVCLFLYLESNQVTVCGKCPKGIRKTRNLFFGFMTNFTWILSARTNLLRYLLQLQISDETNQHPRDTLCNYIRQNSQLYFVGQTLPKKWI